MHSILGAEDSFSFSFYGRKTHSGCFFCVHRYTLHGFVIIVAKSHGGYHDRR